MKNVTESIFSGKTVVIPMADVSHIEKKLLAENETKYACYEGLKVGDIKSLTIITKHTTWNAEQDEYNNALLISNKEIGEFLKAWCLYRHELEKDTLKDIGVPVVICENCSKDFSEEKSHKLDIDSIKENGLCMDCGKKHFK